MLFLSYSLPKDTLGYHNDGIGTHDTAVSSKGISNWEKKSLNELQ